MTACILISLANVFIFPNQDKKGGEVPLSGFETQWIPAEYEIDDVKDGGLHANKNYPIRMHLLFDKHCSLNVLEHTTKELEEQGFSVNSQNCDIPEATAYRLSCIWPSTGDEVITFLYSEKLGSFDYTIRLMSQGADEHQLKDEFVKLIQSWRASSFSLTKI